MSYYYNEEHSAQENIATALYCIANELKKLGMNDASTHLGAVENLAVELRSGLNAISGSVDGLAESVGYLSDNLDFGDDHD